MDRETLDQLLHAELLALLAQQAVVIRRQRDELAEREAAITECAPESLYRVLDNRRRRGRNETVLSVQL
jgi:hypothetical protein